MVLVMLDRYPTILEEYVPSAQQNIIKNDIIILFSDARWKLTALFVTQHDWANEVVVLNLEARELPVL
jgi:hypothetical protein